MKIIIPGRPATKKNSSRAVRAGAGRRLVILPSEAYERYEINALWHFKEKYRGQLRLFTGPVKVTCLYWLADRRSWPDLVGLLQASSDILQKAEIIENDRLIISYDGSRIMGLDKKNPRVEIEVKPYETLS